MRRDAYAGECAAAGSDARSEIYREGGLRRFAPRHEKMPPDAIINAFPQNTANSPKAEPTDPKKSGPTTRAR